MTTKCLIVNFSDCTYSVQELTDEQIADNDAYVFRINDGLFEENILICQSKRKDEDTISTRLLWLPVDATSDERNEQITSFYALN